MNREQAIRYLSNSGFSMIQIETIVKALSTLSEVDFKELKDRYGDEVEYVVRDMISGENLRWVELPRPKRQEPTTKNETLVSLDVYKQVAKERDIAIQQLHELGYDFGQKIEPTTKNDLEVDCISRADAIRVASGYCHPSNVAKELAKLPSVTPQEPRWIPVSEYLPVTNDEVLVTYIVNGNTKKRYVETANCFYGEWSSVNDEYRIPNTKIEIIAWCEMPKPYREVEV